MEPETESTMSTRSRKRTKSKQAWLKHVERAQARGIPLAQYCRERNLSVQSLYSARHQFAKQQRSAAARKKPRSAGKFVEARLATTEPAPASMACRVRVKDCVIECAALPPPSWLTGLMAGGTDALP